MPKADTMSDNDLSGSLFGCMFSRRSALVEGRVVGCLVAKKHQDHEVMLCAPVLDHIKKGQRVQNAEKAYRPQLIRRLPSLRCQVHCVAHVTTSSTMTGAY